MHERSQCAWESGCGEKCSGIRRQTAAAVEAVAATWMVRRFRAADGGSVSVDVVASGGSTREKKAVRWISCVVSVSASVETQKEWLWREERRRQFLV